MSTTVRPRTLALALAGSLTALAHAPAVAQSASSALASRWNTICATATGGTLLFTRCGETGSALDSNPNRLAAEGQRLEEIPGQVRIATRDIAAVPGTQSVQFAGGGVASVFESPWGALGLDAGAPIGAGWSWFASADFGQVDRRRGVNEAGFDADTWSVTVGADWRPTAEWTLGAALNHVSEELDFDASGGSVETRFTGALLLASRSIGSDWALNAYAGQVNGDYDLRREIAYTLRLPSGLLNVDAMATAAPDARRRFAGASAARLWSRNGWDFDFEGGLDWTSTRIDPYTETGGAGLALVVPGRETRTRRARFDFGLARSVSTSWGVWQPSARIGWRQELGSKRRQVTVRLALDPRQYPITFDTEDSDNSWAEVSLGSVFVFTGGHSAFLNYSQRLGHDFLQERIVSLGWRIEL